MGDLPTRRKFIPMSVMVTITAACAVIILYHQSTLSIDEPREGRNRGQQRETLEIVESSIDFTPDSIEATYLTATNEKSFSETKGTRQEPHGGNDDKEDADEDDDDDDEVPVANDTRVN